MRVTSSSALIFVLDSLQNPVFRPPVISEKNRPGDEAINKQEQTATKCLRLSGINLGLLKKGSSLGEKIGERGTETNLG